MSTPVEPMVMWFFGCEPMPIKKETERYLWPVNPIGGRTRIRKDDFQVCHRSKLRSFVGQKIRDREKYLSKTRKRANHLVECVKRMQDDLDRLLSIRDALNT